MQQGTVQTSHVSECPSKYVWKSSSLQIGTCRIFMKYSATLGWHLSWSKVIQPGSGTFCKSAPRTSAMSINLGISAKSTRVKSRTHLACDTALGACATMRRYVGGWKHRNHPGLLAASKRHAPLYHGLGCTTKLTCSSFSPFRASIKTTPESVIPC